MPLSSFETTELRRAKLLLENPGLAAKIGNYLGSPIEIKLKMTKLKLSIDSHLHASR